MIQKFDQWINESNQLHTKEDIANWLDSHNIRKYTINDNLTVDVDGNVDLSDNSFQQFPVQFNKVSGNFFCKRCENLVSLKGSPHEVNGDFDCRWCTNLISLEDAPQKVSGYFACDHCTKLTSLKGIPQGVKHFFCRGCPNLISLEYSPVKIDGNFSCQSCLKLISLKGGPQDVGGDFDCRWCTNLISLEDAPQKIGKEFYCAETIFSNLFNNIKYQDFIKLSRDKQVKLYIKYLEPENLPNMLTPQETHKYRGVIYGSNFGI